jgi:aminoglycoside phosphotransferase family enzyme
VVIDCYNQSPNRRGIDVLDDLGLFAMECERRERQDISDNVMAAYRRVAGDDGFPHLELFYKLLHACTASARAACAAEATNGGPQRRFLDQAAAYFANAEKYAQALVSPSDGERGRNRVKRP